MYHMFSGIQILKTKKTKRKIILLLKNNFNENHFLKKLILYILGLGKCWKLETVFKLYQYRTILNQLQQLLHTSKIIFLHYVFVKLTPGWNAIIDMYLNTMFRNFFILYDKC